ncbi:MAG: response regulator transcription factor [Lachnospiraceae bacterium]|nr:response regulator transcription factor [Lachnospiraceae bacterium]
MTILLVEDNDTIIKGLSYSIEKKGYEFKYRTSFKTAGNYIEENMRSIDLIILDIMLPDGNGFDLYEQFIKPKDIPTIFLTAQDDEEWIVRGLDIGAEDYVTKPFSTKELMARINKVLMRYKKSEEITVKDIRFNMDKMVVYRGDEVIDLSPLELKLLNLLFLDINKVVSRNVILDKIWEWTGNDVDDHTVTVYFKRIREKLVTDIITTVKGVGYRIDDGK